MPKFKAGDIIVVETSIGNLIIKIDKYLPADGKFTNRYNFTVLWDKSEFYYPINSQKCWNAKFVEQYGSKIENINMYKLLYG